MGHQPDACFKVWQETGTDCGICIASCPWTKPRTAFHRMATALATEEEKSGMVDESGRKADLRKIYSTAGAGLL